VGTTPKEGGSSPGKQGTHPERMETWGSVDSAGEKALCAFRRNLSLDSEDEEMLRKKRDRCQANDYD